MVERHASGWVLAVADGAGGTSGGAEAAEQAIASIRADLATFMRESAGVIAHVLARLDAELARTSDAGETTLVVVVVRGANAVGASVGDSEAWDVRGSLVSKLTGQQVRKPLLGSGRAVPVGFGPASLEGRLLVASDGLFRYCTQEQIFDACARVSLSDTAASLLRSVEMPSGGLQDDLGLILCDRSRSNSIGMHG